MRRGRVEIVAAVEGFDGGEVLLVDGSRIDPDAVIAATGFRAGLDGLVGHLGVLGPRGLPTHTDGEPVLPGLWFVGFVPTLGGQLREGSIAAAQGGGRRRSVAARGGVVGAGRLELPASCVPNAMLYQAELRPVPVRLPCRAVG